MNPNKEYFAVTGDVRQSRNLVESDFIYLKNCLSEFNEKEKPVVPFTIQAGDEIQGLFALNSSPISSLLKLLAKVHPIKICWGIGKGIPDSPIQKSTAEMRGKLFEESREALNESMKTNQLFSYNSPDSQINIIFRLLSGFVDDWNQMTFRRFQLYSDTKTIYSVAESEGVSREAVNKHMNRTNIRLVLDVVNYLDETIF